mmetsp:Transcript_62935/g.194861  ORF Transcript_62935/g.194861 Transcript_62935/m.194861 type:complete len:254 (+) Transcript_62935:1853-2614(+)
MASWFSGCTARLARAPSADATMSGWRAGVSPSLGRMSSSRCTPPARRIATRFSSLPARFQSTSTTFSWTVLFSESINAMTLGIAWSSRISALLSSFNARLVSAPKTFSCTSASGELNNETRRLTPPAWRTAVLLSSSTASCIRALAAVCLRDSFARGAAGSRLRAREFFSELMRCNPSLGSCEPLPSATASSCLAVPASMDASSCACRGSEPAPGFPSAATAPLSSAAATPSIRQLPGTCARGGARLGAPAGG